MEQQTTEWSNFRMVRITASRFGDVLAKSDTKRYQYYMDDLVEGLQGFPRIEKYTPWFDHGIEMEDGAKGYYEWERNVEIQAVGSIVHPKYPFVSCSPDGLIGEDGGVELKSHISYKQFLESERKGMPPQYKPQVQGSLWITGRKWWDFVSYYQKNDKRMIHIHCVYPDLKYHKRLEKACLDFWAKVQERLND